MLLRFFVKAVKKTNHDYVVICLDRLRDVLVGAIKPWPHVEAAKWKIRLPGSALLQRVGVVGKCHNKHLGCKGIGPKCSGYKSCYLECIF